MSQVAPVNGMPFRRRHSDGVPELSQWAQFGRLCPVPVNGDPASGDALHRWSVDHFREFWSFFLDWSEVVWEGSAEVVCTSDDVASAEFFPDVRLNYAENLLQPLPSVSDESIALTSVRAGGTVEHISRAELRERTSSTASALAAQGVRAGDRLVLIGANNSRTTIAALAALALGATLSTAMPDMGPAALLDRFSQLEPVVLAVERTGSDGWTGSPGDALSALLDGLPSLRRVLLLDDEPLPGPSTVEVARLVTDAVGTWPEPAGWPRLPFNHPLLVMFSSGTTGPPKAIVHGAGGTLLEHLKEHRLHGDLRAGETLYFHSTTAWMMWNWQLSALAVGTRIVVHDGPVAGPETLWELVAEQRVNVFGTSPAYLQLCQDEGYRPVDRVDLGALRSVLSTGSVLHDWQFDWVAAAVGPQPVQSISGGTDVIGCFVLGHPDRPVVPGRCQSLGLGLDVAALDAGGHPVLDRVGELVCRRPFPSRPIGFLADPDGQRFRQAYFTQHPGVWTHGDLIEIAADGSSRMHGRSDGVLNVDGIRVGPAEIHAIVHGIPQVEQCLAVEQDDPAAPGRTRVVLLVVLRPGHVLNDDLTRLIRSTLRRKASPAHVPSLVLAVDALPTTHNGKLSERAARDALNRVPVANVSSLRNPESLEGIVASLDAAVVVPVPREEAGVQDLRSVVAREFAEALGGPVADTVDFFDAGGTSRGAIRMVRRLRSGVGADVPMSDFLADPSVQGLTVALQAVTDERPSVELLASGDETLPPLYLVHGTFGDVDDYQHLVVRLDVPAPVYGVRGRLVGPDGAIRSVRELAAGHAETLAAFQPEDPVRLAGHSFGGLLAFEIARQLTARGREVSFLGLIDVVPPAAGLTPAQRVARRAAGLLAAAFHIERRTLTEVVRDRVRPQRAKTYFDGPHGRAVTAYHAYRWAPYDGPVTFFRATRRVPVLTHQLHAWRAVAPDLTVVDTPGMHYDVVDGENAVTLAGQLSQALRESAG